MTLPEQGELTVDFTVSPDSLDMYYRVLDPDGGQVWGWQGASVAGALTAHTADIKTPGDYVIEVRDGSSNARSPEPYGLTASFAPTADSRVEPNDVVAQATPIALGTTIVGSILPVGDADHYAFRTTGTDLRVTLTQSPTALDIYVRVLDLSGAQVVGWTGASTAGTLFDAELTVPSAGSYVLEVRDGASNARSPDAYGLVLSSN